MQNWVLPRILFINLLFFLSGSLVAQIKITSALCENKMEPTGISLNHFRFSWELSSGEEGEYQFGWQIGVSSSTTRLNQGFFDIWNSGFIESKQSILNAYKGPRLSPGKIYYWKVRVWDKNKIVSPWSYNNEFTTGLFSITHWSGAHWIGYERLPNSLTVSPGIDPYGPYMKGMERKCFQRSIVPVFRKSFQILRKVSRATVFVTGVGQYQMTINGKVINNSFLSPGWTYYDKRILYNTYDVTEFLNKGQNVLGMIIGNGFYHISRERYFKFFVAFGYPKAICLLKLQYDNGSREEIVSDSSWKTMPSPITYSSIYGGEDYDARLEWTDWDKPGFDDRKWVNSIDLGSPKEQQLWPELDYAVQIKDTFNVKKIYSIGKDSLLYDFAQNASAIIELQVRGNRGDTIRLIPSELITKELRPIQSASGYPYYFTYVLKGSGTETWRPKFSYYGFRYVLIQKIGNDRGKAPEIIRLVSLHTRNSSPTNGYFSCSNELFNQIFELIRWAIKSNLQSVITDCPHREKLSWLEQDYLMGSSIHFNYDIFCLFRKLIFDMMDAQYKSGLIPDIAPRFVVFQGGFMDSPEWGSAAIILPWLLYSWYGDKDILVKSYPMMARYLRYLKRQSRKFILSYGLGDWYDLGPGLPGESQLTPKGVTSTAIYYYDLTIMQEVASVLNLKNNTKGYKILREKVKGAFNQKFYNKKARLYATGSQTAMAMPLALGLVTPENKKAVFKNLIDSIYKGNKALTAGDIGFHFLIEALDEGGASQLIYDMNNRQDVPGYGYQLKRGASALTESWNALDTVSNNHLMLGHLMEWFYKSLAGISQEGSSIAFETLRICPEPVDNIYSVQGSFHTPYGWVSSTWKKNDHSFELSIDIPVNTKANVYLPAAYSGRIFLNNKNIKDNSKVLWRGNKKDKIVFQVGSGKYFFVVEE